MLVEPGGRTGAAAAGRRAQRNRSQSSRERQDPGQPESGVDDESAARHAAGTLTFASLVIGWYQQNARDLPWRRPDFGAWGILVSEFMLQQTPVTRVIPFLEDWLERWPTPAALASARPSDAVVQWANLGYPRRALWLHQAAVEISERHGGVVPEVVDDLMNLRGVGTYTARAVASFAFGHRHAVVDTNTRRVLSRAVLGRSQPGPPSSRDLELMDSLLPADPADAVIVNAGTMELGAVICTSRSPRCEECPLVSVCAWHRAGRPDTGDRRVRQARYEGSDRQARGSVLKALRGATNHRIGRAAANALWPDGLQLDRAVASLVADGLVESDGNWLQLPGSR